MGKTSVLVACVWLAACGEAGSADPAPTTADAGIDAHLPACVPGRSEACACPGGGRGAQICDAAGRYGDCLCGETADAAGSADDARPGDARVALDGVGTPDAEVVADAEAVADAEVVADADAGVDANATLDLGSPPDASRDCEPGAMESRNCGLNGTGVESRVCVAGEWGEYTACLDAAECVDGAQEVTPCGFNGNGRAIRTCVNGTWEGGDLCEDDPDECVEGMDDVEACGLAGLGTRTRTCVDGRYGQFGPCDDPGRMCEDGTVEVVPCGLNQRGQQTHTCVGSQFGPWSACADPDECVDAAVRQEACGFNDRGLRRQTCDFGRFGAFGACDDPDLCIDGTETFELCGFNGRGTRRAVCVGGRVGAFSVCTDPDVCVDGVVEPDPEGCGLNGRGTRSRACAGGQWGEAGPCVDSDQCVDGVVELDACGVAGGGRRTRTCIEGIFGPFGPCIGADECPDPENPRCGPPQPERCNGLDDDHDGSVDEGPARSGAAYGAFEADVDAALEAGTEFVRRHLDAFNVRNYEYFTVLTLLERRLGHPHAGSVGGYRALSAADQALVRRLLADASRRNGNLFIPIPSIDVYPASLILMALSSYLATGGPDDYGGAVTASAALAAVAANVLRIQGGPGAGWGYREPGTGLSATHFAAMGLAAADAFVEGAGATLPRVAGLVARNTDARGGITYYWPDESSSARATSAGIVTYLLAGIPPDDPAVSRAAAWLDAHFDLTRDVGRYREDGTYNGYWTTLMAVSALGETAPRLGQAVPAGWGYPGAKAGIYFDIATRLMSWQTPEGEFGRGAGPQGMGPEASQLFSLLALQRSVAGLREFDANGGATGDCDNGLDDDGDGRMDFPADPDCTFACTATESPQAACTNGLDDDGDGRTDFPVDPGCRSRLDDDEREHEPRPPTACANGLDDDGDGRVDFPADPECHAAVQDDEGDAAACPMGAAAPLLPTQGATAGSTAGRLDLLRGSCGGLGGADAVFTLVVDRPQTVTLSTVDPGTTFDTVLYVLDACQPGAAERACNQDVSSQSVHSALTVDLPAPGLYFVVVDATVGEGDFVLEVSRVPLRTPCGDGWDNDGDGAADMLDVGCADPEGLSEIDPPVRPACGNGVDDDLDGIVDFPAEPGCAGPGDPDEAEPVAPATCDDGLDNDQDGATDYPEDASCAGRGQDSEFAPNAACGDTRDNDADGAADFPLDSGCASPADMDENLDAAPPACANGLDDDRDGVADFPGDWGCEARSDPSEASPGPRPECADGRDDDGDGRTDWPEDPGCHGAGDRSESDPAQAPVCADGRDNDFDGVTDFLADPGCAFAAAGSEDDANMPLACVNGLDDDGDGRVDGLDPGCDGTAVDEDEADPAQPPECADGQDDDGDGQSDFPEDSGCRSAGDAHEDASCRAGVNVANLPRNAHVVGATVAGDVGLYDAACGGVNTGEAVFRYTLRQQADLTFSVANPGTDFDATLSVRTACEEPETTLTCANAQVDATPTITLDDAPPGEYFVFVDGGGSSRLVSSGRPLVFPPGPIGPPHVNIGSGGWQDGGANTLDLFGTTSVKFGNVSQGANVARGLRDSLVNGYRYVVRSDMAHPNVWRVRLEPSVPDDERVVTVTITGDMGCGRSCFEPAQGQLLNRTFRYQVTHDVQPAYHTVQMVIPSRPEEFGRVSYSTTRDQATIVAADVHLPLTFYLALTHTSVAEAAAAVLVDLVPVPTAPAFGAFELTASEQ